MLLSGELLPLTKGVVFVWGGRDDLVDALATRAWRPTWTATPSAQIGDALLRLEPLSIPHPRKMLLVPTISEDVTAVFEDLLDGSELSSLAQIGNLGFDGVGVLSTPNNLKQIAPSWWSGTYGYRWFSEVRADPAVELGFEGRSLGLHTENGRRWTLSGGERPWSAVWDPGARRVIDRFSHEHLVASAASLGLRPFDEDFYVPGGAVLLERMRETYEGEKWGTLSMAQGCEPRVFRSYLTDPPPSPWRR